MTARTLLAFGLVSLLGCGVSPVAPGPEVPPTDPEPSVQAPRSLGNILDEVTRLDREGWAPDDCRRLGRDFENVAERSQRQRGGRVAIALFDAGVAYERCGLDEPAMDAFERSLRAHPRLHQARVHLIAAKVRRGDLALDQAIIDMREVVLDAEYQNVEALLQLARFQLERGHGTPDGAGRGCPDDRTCALRNIMRALAIEPGYVAARNQLAVYYLEEARSGGDSNTFALAEHVAENALVAAPSYAPLHWTMGRIAFEQGRWQEASAAFLAAVNYDPSLFEAHLAYATVRALLGDEAGAKRGFGAVLTQRPGDYDACVGLTRLEGGDPAWDRCIALRPERPEAYYEAARATGNVARQRTLLASFVARAQKSSKWEAVVQQARAWLDGHSGSAP